MNSHGFKLTNPVHFLALGFGAGLSRKAPGTFGTLTAIPVFLLMAQLPPWAYVLGVAALLLAGVYICGRAARDAGVHDHPAIVWDEIVGYLIAMTLIPASWPWVIAGFLLFRLFDIVKPWPISLLDRYVAGGFGIMVDDVLAGLFSLVILHAFQYLL